MKKTDAVGIPINSPVGKVSSTVTMRKGMEEHLPTPAEHTSPLKTHTTAQIMNDMYLVAKVAYCAYGETTRFKNFRGETMPTWESLPRSIKLAWVNASHSIMELTHKFVTETIKK